MNTILQKYKPVHIKVNLLKLEDELNSPTINALIKDGYIISATIPVDDQGIPTALIILTPKIEQHNNHKQLAIIASASVLLQGLCLFALHYFTH
tara:strand:- start:6254 stop:6535 length:282 start_codon:yes stop_codon:yes gene_type:complete